MFFFGAAIRARRAIPPHLPFVVMDASTSNNPTPYSYCCYLIFVSARFPVARCMPRLYCTFRPECESGVPACLQPLPPATIPSACSKHPFCVHALSYMHFRRHFVMSFRFWGFEACAARLLPPSYVAYYITQPPVALPTALLQYFAARDL